MIDGETTSEETPEGQVLPVASFLRPRLEALEGFLARDSLIAMLIIGIVVTVLGNWVRVQNLDPDFSMLLVQRTIRFGGTFFDNAMQDHGPIEPFLYDIAARIGGRNGAWYVVSAMVTGVSLVLAYVATKAAEYTGAAREVAMFAGAAVFIHFTISRSNYAGVLYIRNITTVLLAVAWLLAITESVWASPRQRLPGAIALGALLGLAVQGLFTTAFAAAVIGLVGILTMRTKVEGELQFPLTVFMVGSAAVTFISAPVYYALRGDFTQFWSGWVQYAHYMSVGTGRSLRGQFDLGWSKAFIYYEQRPLAFLLILSFVGVTAVIWRRMGPRARLFHAGLLAWWAAGWLELVVSQRYSGEYFAVTSVPCAFMAAALAGHLWRGALADRVSARALVAVPLVGALIAVYLSGPTNFADDWRSAWHFHGVNANATDAAKYLSGPERTALAVLDLVSHDGDPALIWTNDLWTYLNLKRVPATRFFYKGFLLGEIYLGRTSSAYVLPHAWEWFADDLRQTKPVAYLLADQHGLPGGTPFAKYVAANFDPVMPDQTLPVSLRHDVARALLQPSATRNWVGTRSAAARTSWTIDGNSADYRPGVVPAAADQLVVATKSCFRLEGTIATPDRSGVGRVSFHFYDNAGRNERLNLTFDGDTVTSSSDFTQFQSEPSDVPGGAQVVPFALVVGRRSAALVINNQVRAATLLPKSVTVRAEAPAGALRLSNLRLGPAPAGSGC